MSVVAAVLTGWAVYLAVGTHPARVAAVRLSAEPVAVLRTGRRRVAMAAVIALAVAVVLGAAGLVGGRPGLVVGACLAMVTATSTMVVRGHRRGRAVERRRREVARACAVLAAELRIGKVPGEALLTAAEDEPVLAAVAAVHRSGGEVVPVLRELAARPGAAGLTAVADAWQVSERTGAPLTGALDRVSSALKADQTVHRTVAAELAAPRATGRLLAALPAVGLVLGFAVGGDPIAFLLGAGPGQLCLVVGVALACVGVLWSERLAR